MTLFVQGVEGFQDRFTADGIQGEGGSIPIARGAQFLELLQYDAAMLVGPFPCMLQEFLPA